MRSQGGLQVSRLQGAGQEEKLQKSPVCFCMWPTRTQVYLSFKTQTARTFNALISNLPQSSQLQLHVKVKYTMCFTLFGQYICVLNDQFILCLQIKIKYTLNILICEYQCLFGTHVFLKKITHETVQFPRESKNFPHSKRSSKIVTIHKLESIPDGKVLTRLPTLIFSKKKGSNILIYVLRHQCL